MVKGGGWDVKRGEEEEEREPENRNGMEIRTRKGGK